MLEHDDVLRDGIKGNGEIPGDFGNTGGALAELLQNCPTGWVGNRAEDVVERFRRTINHRVEDSSRSQDQQAVKMRHQDCLLASAAHQQSRDRRGAVTGEPPL
jgi:hypothetical protein